MKMLVAIAAGALVAVAAGASPPSTDPEVAAFACQLGGDCGSASPSAAADPGGPAPRSAAVRGFTFRRTGTSDGTTTTATSSSTATSTGTGTTPVAASAAMPAPHGAADLRLSFASGSSMLDDGDRARLAKLATALGMPKLNGRHLRIEGHTDSKGSATANLDLSRRRAQAVADFLASNGVGSDRLQVVGYGAARPLPGHSAGDGANRRVMAVMLD